MPLTPKQIDFTDKDFDSMRLRLRNLIRSVFPEWTDFNVANFGNILLELFAQVGDILTFYQDNQARQSRIVTATQRKAILGLVKLINFTPSTATAATVDVTLTLASTPTGSVTIPKGSFVRTEEVTDPIRYQLLADAVIAAGASPATAVVSCENSEPRDENFLSTALPNQTISLASTPYIDGSAVVTAGNGTYTQVTDLLSSTSTDLHYVVVVDQNDRATLRFGNGVNGAIPVGGIAVSYKIGGGSAGRVEQNKLKVVEGAFTDSFGNPVTVTATNASASSGGSDRQSVAQIKERAPAALRVLNRTVAREDFEINALRLTDVARALMLTKNEDASVGENQGQLYIVPVGGGAASQALKDAVLTQVTVTYPCTLTFSVGVYDAVYKMVDVYAAVYFKAGYTKATVAAAIRSALAAFFEPQNSDGTANTLVDFGANLKDANGNVTGELAFSDLFDVVRDTAGVRKVGSGVTDFTLNGQHADVVLIGREFPKLGTVTIIDADTGANL